MNPETLIIKADKYTFEIIRGDNKLHTLVVKPQPDEKCNQRAPLHIHLTSESLQNLRTSIEEVLVFEYEQEMYKLYEQEMNAIPLRERN